MRLDELFDLAEIGMKRIKAEHKSGLVSWLGQLPTEEELQRAKLYLDRTLGGHNPPLTVDEVA